MDTTYSNHKTEYRDRPSFKTYAHPKLPVKFIFPAKFDYLDPQPYDDRTPVLTIDIDSQGEIIEYTLEDEVSLEGPESPQRKSIHNFFLDSNIMLYHYWFYVQVFESYTSTKRAI